MNSIANVLDLELNRGNIIEIGVTQVDLKNLSITMTSSFCIWPQPLPLQKDIINLTGLTDKKLESSGISLEKACSIIANNYGPRRLLVTDSDNELHPFNRKRTRRLNPFIGPQLNITNLFKIATNSFDKSLSLSNMLKVFDLEFEGTLHRAGDDSKNIARLFIIIMEILKEKNLTLKLENT